MSEPTENLDNDIPADLAEDLADDLAAAPEPDGDQLPQEDTLIPSDVDDILDVGYSPADEPRHGLYDDVTGSLAGSISAELAAEEPDFGAPDQETDDFRAGRLVADADALEGRDNDIYADDEGVDGGAASAEEAAVHIIPEAGDDA